MTVFNIISRSKIPTLRLCLQYFHVSRQWHGCQHLGFLTGAHMLMHVTAHGGYTNTVRESGLKAGCWRKAPCRTGDWNQCSQRAGPVAQSTDWLNKPPLPRILMFIIITFFSSFVLISTYPVHPPQSFPTECSPYF